MHQHSVQGVAHGGGLRLGVIDQGYAALQVRGSIHEQVAHADSAVNHGHPRVLAHEALQLLSSPGYHEIDQVVHAQEFGDERMVRGRHELDGILRQPVGHTGLPHGVHEHMVGE